MARNDPNVAKHPLQRMRYMAREKRRELKVPIAISQPSISFFLISSADYESRCRVFMDQTNNSAGEANIFRPYRTSVGLICQQLAHTKSVTPFG